MNSPEQNAEPRSGIPSVPTSAIHWFYALFSIGTIYLTAANTLEQAARVKATGWLEIQSIATVQLLQSAGASIAGAAIIVEGVSMVLAAIIRERNRRKDEEEARKREEETLRREEETLRREEETLRREEETLRREEETLRREEETLRREQETLRRHEEALQRGQEEGRNRGRRETQVLWTEWNQRRLDAEQEGRPFDEPPPQIGNHH
jgi:hypothetical protein